MEIELNEEQLCSLPFTAKSRILRHLRWFELQSLREAYREFDEICDAELRRCLHEFDECNGFKWNRCAPNSNDAMPDKTRMAMARVEHYCYAFGGLTIEECAGRRTPLNDFWRIDLRTMQWNRIVVPTTPYPRAKHSSAMVEHEGRLVLIGGTCLPRLDERMMVSDYWMDEAHVYDVRANQWKVLSTINSCNIIAPSAISVGNYILAYGGFEGNGMTMNSIIGVLDVKNHEWKYIDLMQGRPKFDGTFARYNATPPPKNEYYPNLNPLTSSIIHLKDGLALLIGDMHNRETGSAVLVEYDASTMTNWRWKRISVDGKWKVEQEPRQASRSFWRVVAAHGAQTVRLVTMGPPRTGLLLNSDEEARRVAKCAQKRAEIVQMIVSANKPVHKCEEVWCEIRSPELIKLATNRALTRFDDVDEHELKVQLKCALSNKRYEPPRHRPGMTMYVAEVDPKSFDEIVEIRFEANNWQRRAPPITVDYSICDSGTEIVMHGGCIQNCEKMGYTYLLTPARVDQ